MDAWKKLHHCIVSNYCSLREGEEHKSAAFAQQLMNTSNIYILKSVIGHLADEVSRYLAEGGQAALWYKYNCIVDPMPCVTQLIIEHRNNPMPIIGNMSQLRWSTGLRRDIIDRWHTSITQCR